MMLSMFLLAGCAGSQTDLAGKHGKNGGPVRVERLGIMTTSELPADGQCRAREVRWCSSRGRGVNCQCVLVQEAKDRVRRLATQMRNRANVH